MALREDQIQRYSRHILLPDVGGIGQSRLLASTAAVDINVGAAAYAALAYLAAAGVGTLQLGGESDAPISEDDIDTGILFGPADLGRSRFDAICQRLGAINPDCTVTRKSAAPATGPALSFASSMDSVSTSDNSDTSDSVGHQVADALVQGGRAAARFVHGVVSAS